MEAETEVVLRKYIKEFVECKDCGCSYVRRKATTEHGMTYLVNRLFELMEQYKDFTPSNCMAQIEVELSDIDNNG